MQTRKTIAEKFGVHPITVAVWSKHPDFKEVFEKHEHRRIAGRRTFYTYEDQILLDLANSISSKYHNNNKASKGDK
jgi:hypothetical protein